MLSNFNFLLNFLVHGWKWPKDSRGIGLKDNLLSYDYVSDEVDSSDGKWVVRKVMDKTLIP